MGARGYCWLLLLGLCCTGYNAALTDVEGWVQQLHSKLVDIQTELDEYMNTNSSQSDQLAIEQLEVLIKPLREHIAELDQDPMKPDPVNCPETIQDTQTDNLESARIERILATHLKDFTPPHNFTDDLVPTVHTDCKAAYEAGWVESGVYRIKPNGRKEMNVYCEQEKYGGGWVVIQRRFDGNEDFFRNWQDYKDGFGDLHGEHWLGNYYIHQLTVGQDQKLKVELQDGGHFGYADYSSFAIGDEDDKYKLLVSGFSSTNGPEDSLTRHNGQFYSTRDRDNDESTDFNDAVEYKGAWWYKNGYSSNLNSIYGGEFPARISWNWSSHPAPTGVRMMLKTK